MAGTILWQNKQPTPEELEEIAESRWQAALANRDDELREALAREADPVFFKYQRDEATREEWLETVAAVKARYPKPVRA